MDRYEAICSAQQALKSDLIDAFEDDKVYNKIGADGEPKTLEELKPPYIYVKPKKGLANTMATYYWCVHKTTQVYEVSQELHKRHYYSLQ